MTDFTYLDIETLPTQSDDVRVAFRAEIKPPGNIKKPESIAAWMAESGDAAASEAIAKTSFDPAYGHICTVAWAQDDGEIFAAHARTIGQEADVIRAFFGSIDKYHSTCFVGHYINGFDIRFLLCRAVVLGIRIPHQIPRDPKPWDKGLADTMTMWAGAKGHIGLSRLAAALGVDAGGDFDGSMVAQAWADGEHDKITEYCRDDVRIVRDVHRKFIAAGF